MGESLEKIVSNNKINAAISKALALGCSFRIIFQPFVLLDTSLDKPPIIRTIIHKIILPPTRTAEAIIKKDTMFIARPTIVRNYQKQLLTTSLNYYEITKDNFS